MRTERKKNKKEEKYRVTKKERKSPKILTWWNTNQIRRKNKGEKSRK
jgi:hypothetical protein